MMEGFHDSGSLLRLSLELTYKLEGGDRDEDDDNDDDDNYYDDNDDVNARLGDRDNA